MQWQRCCDVLVLVVGGVAMVVVVVGHVAMVVWHASLEQVIRFDPSCLVKSDWCPAENSINEELNATQHPPQATTLRHTAGPQVREG